MKVRKKIQHRCCDLYIYYHDIGNKLTKAEWAHVEKKKI